MSKKLLFIGHTWPEPNSTAAGTRMMQLIHLMQHAGYQITFCSAAVRNDYSVNLDLLNVNQQQVLLNDDSFDQWVKLEMFDVVIYDRFVTEEQFGWRFRESCPKSVNILDTEDLHLLRKAREVALKDKEPLSNKQLYNTIAMREIASIFRCDMSLIISKYEMNLLFYLPFTYTNHQLSQLSTNQCQSYQERVHFSTIGNFMHQPNYDAVHYLKDIIWPLISKELPQAELHIYGSYTNSKVQQLNNQQQKFYIKGRADHALNAVGSSRVMLAPLRYGAGLKGKLLTAMQSGTPFVATDIALEGLNINQQDNYIKPINDPVAFAHHAIRLYTDNKLWHDYQRIGFNKIKQQFALSDFYDTLISTIEQITSQLSDHRNTNFIGMLIKHHYLNSTKYLSKWIQEKNKKY